MFGERAGGRVRAWGRDECGRDFDLAADVLGHGSHAARQAVREVLGELCAPKRQAVRMEDTRAPWRAYHRAHPHAPECMSALAPSPLCERIAQAARSRRGRSR